MKNNYERESYDKAVGGGLAKKAENFWYHYKWHTIVTIFIVIVVAVCTAQMCSRINYDVYVLYAGGKAFNKSGENSEYEAIHDALKIVSEDFDENGENLPLFQSYLLPTSKEYSEKYADRGLDSLITADKDSFTSAMLGSGEFYLCFLSPELFATYDEPLNSGIAPIISLTEYASSEQLTESGRGIKLSETDFYKLPGINALPADTIICIRTLSTVSGDEKSYENSLVLLQGIMSYKFD